LMPPKEERDGGLTKWTTAPSIWVTRIPINIAFQYKHFRLGMLYDSILQHNSIPGFSPFRFPPDPRPDKSRANRAGQLTC
jgi:hypothetical protein